MIAARLALARKENSHITQKQQKSARDLVTLMYASLRIIAIYGIDCEKSQPQVQQLQLL
jgi:hypothetical protein